jgi:hypothetical protein
MDPSLEGRVFLQGIYKVLSISISKKYVKRKLNKKKHTG